MYKPYEERTPDMQYQDLLRRVLNEGEYTKNPFQDKGTITHLSLPPLVYRFSNGFPLLTERRISFWKKPISEIIAFMNGARTLSQLAEYGTEKTWASWWDQWVTPEKCAEFGLEAGDLGPGSYGGIFHDMPTSDGGSFNQFLHLLEQVKAYPSLRTHMVTSWYPPFVIQSGEKKRQVVVAPCHGNLIKITIINGKLTLRQVQRSGDFPVGVPSNIIQYAALTLMIAHILGVEPYQYVHDFLDAQIYEDQVSTVEEFLKRTSSPFPTMSIDTGVTDLFAFRPDHFTISDYHPLQPMNFPVTI